VDCTGGATARLGDLRHPRRAGSWHVARVLMSLAPLMPGRRPWTTNILYTYNNGSVFHYDIDTEQLN
jgi:hypothetical protein